MSAVVGGGEIHQREAAGGSSAGIAAKVRKQHSRSDVGTIVIHWLVAAAMVASLLTGLRISADQPDSRVAKYLSPILPQGEIWTVHFIAGLTFFFGISAYLVYMIRGRLLERNALKKIGSVTLPGKTKAARKARWGGVNVALHWLMYGIIAVMTATGIALYLGYGGWVVWLHATCALISLAYIFVHVVTHFMYGGWDQMLRLFRPSKLAGDAARSRPLLVATAVGIPVIAGIAYADVAARSQLVIGPVATPPVLSNLLADPAWKVTRPVFVKTMQGANFGGPGETTVEIRALHDDQDLYFAFRWWDPTRSLRRVPMIKQADGWHVLDPATAGADSVVYYEDKLAVIFSSSDAFGSGGSTHMGPDPLPGSPKPLNGRGFHFTDGEYIDMWQWKAARGGLLGSVENMHIGPPTVPTEAEKAVKGRYQAGYWGDPGTTMYRYNFPFEPTGGYLKTVTPSRLPKDWRATQAALGANATEPDKSVDEGSKWWMFEAADTVPYTKELDAEIPVGTVMPGVLITADGYTGGRGGISASAEWKDDYWTLVAKRKLKTGSKHDKDFGPGSHYYLWVSAFDHTQTRHTRHMRPVDVVFR